MNRKTILALTVASAAAVGAFSASANAATVVNWSGASGTDLNWSTAGNWDVAPANDLVTNIANFGLADYTTLQPNVSAPTSINGVTITGTLTGAPLNIGGVGPLSIGSGGIAMSGAPGAATISAPIIIAATQNWSNSAATPLAIAGTVTRNVGTTVNVSGTGTFTTTELNDGSLNATGSTGGIIGPWMTIGTGANTRFATNLTNAVGGTIGAYNDYSATASTNYPSGNLLTNSTSPVVNANGNFEEILTAQAAPLASRYSNTIIFTMTTAQSYVLPTTANVTFSSNAIMNDGPGTLTFSGGSGTASAGLAIGQNGTKNEMILDATGGSIVVASGTLLLNSASAQTLTTAQNGNNFVIINGFTTVAAESGGFTQLGSFFLSGNTSLVAGTTGNVNVSGNASLGASQTWTNASAANLNFNGTLTHVGVTADAVETGTGSITTPFANDASSGGGIVGGWLVFGTGTSAQYASSSAAGANLTAYTGATAETDPNTMVSGTTNYAFAPTATVVTTQGVAANTIRFTGTAGRTVTLGAAATSAFTVTANGILNASANGTTGQSLTFNNGAGNTGSLQIGPSNELALYNAVSGGSINFGMGLVSNSSTPQSVATGGTGSVSLLSITSSGSGGLTVGGNLTLNLGGGASGGSNGTPGIFLGAGSGPVVIATPLVLLAFPNTAIGQPASEDTQIWQNASSSELYIRDTSWVGTQSGNLGVHSASLNVQQLGTGLITTAATNGANGIVGPWASWGTGTNTQYLTVTTTPGTLSAYGVTGFALGGLTSNPNASYSAASNPNSLTTNTINYDLSSNAAPLTASALAYTVRYTGAGVGDPLDIGTTPASGLTLQVRGLMNAGTGKLTIANGAVVFNPTLSNGNELDMYLNSASNDIELVSPIKNVSTTSAEVHLGGPNRLLLNEVDTTLVGTSNSGSITIVGQQNTSNNNSSSTGGVVYVGSSGKLNLNAVTSGIGVQLPIADNPTTPGSFVVINSTGSPTAGTVALTGNDLFTGGVILNSGGNLGIGGFGASNNGLGPTAATFIINGGQVFNNSSSGITLTNNNPITINGSFNVGPLGTAGGGTSLNFGTGAVTLTQSATISNTGTGTYTFGGVGQSTLGLSLSVQGPGRISLGSTATPNSFTGPLTIGIPNGATGQSLSGTENPASASIVLPSVAGLVLGETVSTPTPTTRQSYITAINSTTNTVTVNQLLPAAITINSGVTSGSTAVTGVSTAGLAVGDFVTGTGIAAATQITAIGTNSITLSQNATTTGTPILSYFSNLAQPVNFGPSVESLVSLAGVSPAWDASVVLNPSGNLVLGSNSIGVGSTVTINGGVIQVDNNTAVANSPTFLVDGNFTVGDGGGNETTPFGSGKMVLNPSTGNSVTITLDTSSSSTLAHLNDNGHGYGVNLVRSQSLATSGSFSLPSADNFTGALSAGNGVTVNLNATSSLSRDNVVNLSGGATLGYIREGTQIVAGLNDDGTGVLDGGGAADYSSTWIGGSGNYSFGGVIDKSTSLFMAGAPSAVQTLYGANTYHNISGAGATWVVSGTLNLDFSHATSPQNNILYHNTTFTSGAPAVPLNYVALAGGTLELTGSASQANSQSFTDIAMDNGNYGSPPAGAAHIKMVTSGQDLALSVGNIVRTQGATLDVTLAAGSGAGQTLPTVSGGNITAYGNGVQTTASNTNGIIGGFATVSSGSNTDWATVTGGTHVAGTLDDGTLSSNGTGSPTFYGSVPNGTPISFNSLTATGISNLNAGQLYYVIQSYTAGFLGSNPAFFQVAAAPGATLAAGTASSGATGTATFDTLGNITALAPAGYTAFTSPGADETSSDNLNTLLANTGEADSLTNTLMTNTLKITTTVSGGSLTIAGGKTLSLATGGLLFNGTGDYTITGGTISVPNGDYIIQQYGTGNLTIASTFAKPNFGQALTKSGPGTLTLTGTSNLTGVVAINQGILNINSLAAIGTGGERGGIVFNGGTLQYAAGFTGSGDISRRGNVENYGVPFVSIMSGGATIDTNGNNIGYAASIGLGDANGFDSLTGQPILTGGLTKAGLGTLTLAAVNRYTGPTTITGGGTLSVGTVISTTVVANSNGTTDLAVTLTDTNGLVVGQPVTGGDMAAGTVISAIADATDVTLSLPAGGTNAGESITFGAQPVIGLANGGAVSAIGSSTNAASNLVLDNGTLQYTGLTTSTDRNFTVTQNGGGIDASGTGTLTFANTSAIALTGSGARTLSLIGSNTGNNTLDLSLGDGTGGATALLKDGAGTWVLNNVNSYSGGTTINNGTLVLAAAGSLPNATAVVNNGTLTVNANNTASVITGTGTTNIAAATTLAINATPVVAGPGPRNANATTSVMGSLNIAGGATPTGSLNLNNNALIITGGGTAERDLASAEVANARNGGLWNQPGITSTNAQASFAGTHFDSTTLGVVLNSDLPTPYAIFNGKTVGASDVLIKYTYGGDADLSGTINGNDYFQIDRGFLDHYTGWVNGDFNYDGTVNGNDYFIIDSNFIDQSGQLAASEVLAHAAEFGPSYLSEFTSSQLAAIGVPEPTSLALLGLGAVGLLARRKRKA